MATEDAGITRDKAEQVATAVLNAIRDNVATKADIDALRHVMQEHIAKQRAMRADIDALPTQADIDELRDDLKASVRAEWARMAMWLGALAVVLADLLFAALHYWPPHG